MDSWVLEVGMFCKHDDLVDTLVQVLPCFQNKQDIAKFLPDHQHTVNKKKMITMCSHTHD